MVVESNVPYHVDTSVRPIPPKPPSPLRSLFSPVSKSLRKMDCRGRSRGSGDVPSLCLGSCVIRNDQLVVQDWHTIGGVLVDCLKSFARGKKKATYRFWTSFMKSPTRSTSFAAAGNAARSTPFGEPSASVPVLGASLFMADELIGRVGDAGRNRSTRIYGLQSPVATLAVVMGARALLIVRRTEVKSRRGVGSSTY